MRFPISTFRTDRGPSLPAMARNATQAAVRVAGAAVRKQRVQVSEEEACRRLAICLQCPGEHYAADQQRCLHVACGCFVRWKTRLSTESCPVGFW